MSAKAQRVLHAVLKLALWGLGGYVIGLLLGSLLMGLAA